MRSGWSIGRLFGITVTIDWSWLFIFVLVTWNLAGAVFPRLHPGWGTGLTWGLAVIAALLFFASVLAHELAHSLVAKAQGLPVRNITLFLFGGVSNVQREPPSPGKEFLMTIVGPITSLVLGAIFLVLGGIGIPDLGGAADPSGIYARLGPLATLLLWLGTINILLGLFNLIPGFPLDGGRVLRSLLWALTGNLRRATGWAAAVGHLVAWLFIIAGIAMIFGVPLPIFGTGFLSGLWLAFIGWFLNSAATQSYQQVVVRDLLEGVPVGRLMRSGDIATVRPTSSIGELVYERMLGSDERAFPILEGEALVGLVCLEDVRKVPRGAWETTAVAEIMTPADRLAAVAPQEDAGEALNTLVSRDVNQVPVVDRGRLVGMLRRRDILRWLQLHSEGARA